MFVCLCLGITNQTVSDAVVAGATSSRQVADKCGAGTECGRCRQTIRSIIDSAPRIAAEQRKGSST